MMSEYTWLPSPGEDFSEYCGGAGDCDKCPIRNTCSERERIERALEEEEIGGEED